MGQFMGVLALLLSETPVLKFNVTRYTTALTQAMNNLKPTNATVLGKTLMTSHFKHTKSPFYFRSTSKCHHWFR
jgi:hypothetical protein